ncbi:MAG: Hydroxymethylbilane synthase [Chthoniobacteraceae bacterium]|nr:Hydroxymethylbilane synthase [Chthoniobacteraceae bacterium]
MKEFVIGTRGSPLALAQSDLTRAALSKAFPDLRVEVKTFTTRGDQKLDLNLLKKNEAGGKGLFTKELEDALLNGSIDVAVHSLKDLPGHNPAGLQLAAVLERAPTADVLITREAADFNALPQGARIGTSSIRRARQISWLRPDLIIGEWRGNVQTRLRKLGASEETAGIILAEAGLVRLGFDLSDGILEFEQWRFRVSSLEAHLLPAIGQGAIALQSCVGRDDVTLILRALNHEPTLVCIRAERELQRLLSGDCSLPVGVRTRLHDGILEMRGILFGVEGTPPIEAQAAGTNPEEVAALLFAGLEAGASSGS